MARKISKTIEVLLLWVAIGSVSLLAAPTVGVPVSFPATVPVGQPTLLLITSKITKQPGDPAIIANGVNLLRVDGNNQAIGILGVLHDDGLNGDSAAGDGVFSFRFTANESAPGEIRLQVTAAFEGLPQRIRSPIGIVPVIQNSASLVIVDTPTPPPNQAGWNNTIVTVNFTCSGGVGGVASCPAPVTVSTEGANQPVSGTATDRAGNMATASVTLNIDRTPPVLTVTSPANGATISTPQILLTGTASDALSGLAGVTCSGSPATLTGSSFSCSVSLSTGTNSIQVNATDIAGKSNTVTLSVIYTPLTPIPKVTITAPPNLSFVNISPITVNGMVSDPADSLTVNGIATPLSGGSFSVSVPLLEGNNTITAVAQNKAGVVGTASIQVTLDTTPPKVTIDSPFAGFVTTDASITVSGKANDLVVGTVNDQQVQVTVNGKPAQVANRNFQVTGVDLALGDNAITAVGRDRAGNGATVTISARRVVPSGPQLKLISGNNQSGVVGSQLPQPLVIAVVDESVNPLSNQSVVFSVTQNNGTLDNNRATEVITTDSQGKAQVRFTLGTRSGAGSNIVQATAAGVTGNVLFTATGLPTVTSNINVDAGSQQTGVAGQQLPFPFVAVVTDAAHNRLANVAVTFEVKKGGGNFNGQPSLTTNTDSDGRSAAFLTLGSEEGIENNVVEATFAGNPGFPAAFSASGRVPGNASATRISGIVVDNTNAPVPGAMVRAFLYNVPAQVSGGLPANVSAQTDQQGQFSIQAPVGFVKLIVDGSTIQRAGKWPNLEYELVTVAGQNNTLGQPIYLLALDTQNQLCVSPTIGGTLTLPQVPGFSLTVQAGAATFPGGSKTGCVTVTPVHPDKIPMVPGFGQQPKFIVTIQPAGTTFNPPAAISFPNAEGLKAREVTEMYSFDHDLATFVSIGTATVSDDGTVLRSDPGVGLIKAGWNSSGNNNPTGSVGTCQSCYKCQGSQCVPDLTVKTTALTATSTVSANSPQVFVGEMPHQFNPTPADPGQHIAILYKDVVDTSAGITLPFAVRPYTVAIDAAISCTPSNAQWRLSSSPVSASILNQTGTHSELSQLTKGGLYKITYVPPTGVTSEVNVVLPLAGADVTQRIITDLTLANQFASKVIANYNILERNSPLNGARWFIERGNGDYLGRPDSTAARTVHFYNQVNDTNGMGAVATWYDVPTKLAKMSNFMVGYAAQKIGVLDRFAWISQLFGTTNDMSATLSWQAGWDLAKGTITLDKVPSIVRDMFDKADDKNMKLWPNSNPADNFAGFDQILSYDTQFSHPGFLEMNNP